ncbi:MAG: hypothetical protein MUC77_04580 [Chromatiaceae bacterium]|jgi:hypothetical protein|nr:hypothetical protein [Chromatiaceae bacterium]
MNPARDWYATLLRDARLVEIRHNTGKRWLSGLFNDLDSLLDTLRHRAGVGALYTSLNRPAGRTATNDMQAGALKDADIGTITRLPFDFDPIRPVDTPSTHEELRRAVDARGRFVTLMQGFGWPLPALGLSGNGAHCVYRVCVEADEAWGHAVSVIYAGARRVLGDLDGVTFDTSVRNPARIWRAYGTINRKGEASISRPHRRSQVLLPSPWQVVTVAQIARVVDYWDRPAERSQPVLRGDNVVPLRRGGGDYSTLDAVRWFRAHGHYRRELGDGRHAVACPWDGEHSTRDGAMSTATVIWETGSSGWPTFHCSHAHCQGRTLRDVLALWGDADQFCARAWEGLRHG